jgi:hypothetical protein
MEELISDPYVKNEEFILLDFQDLINSEGCDFTFDSSITEPVTNVPVVSTHPAVANTTDNSEQQSFSELISPEHADELNVCNNADIQHLQETQQQQQQVVPYSTEYDKQVGLSLPTSPILPKKATKKIRRPPNAFILFSNEWRGNLAQQYPQETNQGISVRLGVMWKCMKKEEKDVYKVLAREADAEHKRKYPDYVYSPREARVRKALRAKRRNKMGSYARCHTATASLPGSSAQHQQEGNKTYQQAFQPGVTARQPHSQHNHVSSKVLLAEQQRSLEEPKKAVREQVERGVIQGCAEIYLDIDFLPYQQLANHMNLPGSSSLSTDGQQLLPYVKMAQPDAPYVMRPNEEQIKNDLTQCPKNDGGDSRTSI